MGDGKKWNFGHQQSNMQQKRNNVRKKVIDTLGKQIQALEQTNDTATST